MESTTGYRGFMAVLIKLLVFQLALSVWANPLLQGTSSVADTFVAGSQSTCRNPLVRKEWRTLSIADRKDYIRAVKCLMTKPPLTSKSDLPGVTSRFEDFLGTHITQTPNIHFVGIFYPFHRLMLAVYEQQLRACGYSGAQPYWDWTLDTSNPSQFAHSAIFDPVTGFGGNGAFVPGNVSNPAPGLTVGPPFDIPDRTGGGCIPNGPFRNLLSHMGPGASTSLTPHCVRRDLAPYTLANNSGPAMVADGMAQPDYGWFERTTEFTIHAGGHWGIGGLYGDMSNMWSSPGDPLFYLHHANMDRAWWSWQSKNLGARLTDMSGPLVQFDYGNQQGGNATLETPIHVGSTANVTAKVRDVMNIKGGLLCYTYDKLYT